MGTGLHVRLIKTYLNKKADGTEDFSYYWILMDDTHGMTYPLGIYSDYDIKKLVKDIKEQKKEFDL